MNIEYNEYNVGKVDIGTVVDSTKTEIGDAKDLAKISKIIQKSGLVIIKFKISSTEYIASLSAVVEDSDVILSGVIAVSGEPAFVTAVLEADTSKAYATLAVTAMPSAKSAAKK